MYLSSEQEYNQAEDNQGAIRATKQHQCSSEIPLYAEREREGQDSISLGLYIVYGHQIFPHKSTLQLFPILNVYPPTPKREQNTLPL